MAWEADAFGRGGRQQTYSDATIQACLTLIVLFGLPLRQTTGFVESLLKLVGLDWAVPDFSTLRRRQRTLSVALPYLGSAVPLHLLIDSTGIKAEGEGAWYARKHGRSKRRLWRKMHIGIDEQTLEIRAIEATSSSILMRLCSLVCSTRSHQTKRSGVLQRTVHRIRANAMMPLRLVIPMRSFHRAKTPNFGNLTRPVRGREMKLSDLHNIWGMRCGGS